MKAVEAYNGTIIMFLETLPLSSLSYEAQNLVNSLSLGIEDRKIALVDDTNKTLAFIITGRELAYYSIFELLAKIPGVREQIEEALAAFIRLKRRRKEASHSFFARLLLERLNEFFKFI